MNKNIIFLISFIILLIAVGSAFYFFVGKKPQIKTGDVITQPTEKKKMSEKDIQSQTSEIVRSGDFSSCEKIEDAIYKAACVNNIALNLAQEKKDTSYCKKLDGKLMSQESCERQVGFQAAVEKNDVNICDSLSASLVGSCKENFYMQTALKTSDSSLCKNISKKDKQDLCFNNYILSKDFSKDIKGFNCEIFKGIEVVSDCKMIQKLKGSGPILGPGACLNLKTNLFLQYCI